MATKKQTPLEKAVLKNKRLDERLKTVVNEYNDLSDLKSEALVKAKNLEAQLSATKSENAALRSDIRTLRDNSRDNHKVFDVMRKEREVLLKVMDKLVS